MGVHATANLHSVDFLVHRLLSGLHKSQTAEERMEAMRQLKSNRLFTDVGGNPALRNQDAFWETVFDATRMVDLAAHLPPSPSSPSYSHGKQRVFHGVCDLILGKDEGSDILFKAWTWKMNGIVKQMDFLSELDFERDMDRAATAWVFVAATYPTPLSSFEADAIEPAVRNFFEAADARAWRCFHLSVWPKFGKEYAERSNQARFLRSQLALACVRQMARKDTPEEKSLHATLTRYVMPVDVGPFVLASVIHFFEAASPPAAVEDSEGTMQEWCDVHLAPLGVAMRKQRMEWSQGYVAACNSLIDELTMHLASTDALAAKRGQSPSLFRRMITIAVEKVFPDKDVAVVDQRARVVNGLLREEFAYAFEERSIEEVIRDLQTIKIR